MINGKVAKLRKAMMNKRIGLFLFLFLSVQLFFYMDKHELINIPGYLSISFEISVFIVATLLIISVILRLTSNQIYRLFEGEMEIEHRIFLSKMYSFFLYIVGFSLILWKVGVSAGNITIFLGLVTTGFAFAIRDVLMSIFAWLIVLTKKPFKIHDGIKIGDEIGEVVRIGTFYITLQIGKDALNLVKVPNKLLLEKPISNFGKKRRSFMVKVPLDEIPEDGEKRCEKLKLLINQGKENREFVSVKVDSEGVNWFLHVTLISTTIDEGLHNEVMFKARNIFTDFVKKRKEPKS